MIIHAEVATFPTVAVAPVRRWRSDNLIKSFFGSNALIAVVALALITALTFWIFRVATYFVIACAAYIFLDIGIKGSRTLFTSRAPFINVPFFTQRLRTLYVFNYEGKKYTLSDSEFRVWKAKHPVEVEAASVAYSAGGVWPCIVGTALLVIGSMFFALAVGICSAVYLNEYSQNTRFIRLIHIAILNLAGVPSIVFGLFGFGLFVIFLHWNVSLLAGWFTLGLMILPATIIASEESLRAVPNGLREGSLALGATNWQTIRRTSVPTRSRASLLYPFSALAASRARPRPSCSPPLTRCATRCRGRSLTGPTSHFKA
jgi:ABC-type phosphate transport system permease subunit